MILYNHNYLKLANFVRLMNILGIDSTNSLGLSQRLCKPLNLCKIELLSLEVLSMARKNDTPQKAAMRELMSGYLKQNNVKIKDGTDVNAVMRDMMSVILEGALDEEMNEELGYSKYDYRNKEMDNSKNGDFQKTMHTSYGDKEIDILRDRKGEYELQAVKKTRIPSPETWKKKILSMFTKGMTTNDIGSHMR